MSFSKSLSPARLYIGLGGSGARTLAEFAETLVDHQQHGAEAETHMAFVLIDTDIGDLRDAEERIRKTCDRIASKPIIRTVHTSEGVPNFSAFCASRLQEAGHGPRMQEAWWYETVRGQDAVPFTAERMKGMADLGAGQCPAVSTFFGWNSLNHIGDVLKSVVDDLKRYITLKSLYQNWVLHTSIVGSLAGGTGRGCWHLVAYKVREVLAQIGRQTSPIGYFYDASIFESLLHDPARGTKMKINALTGFSELTGWMRNETERRPFLFRLPSLDRPEDPTADVINVERIVRAVDGTEVRGGVHGHSPLNEAFVIFKSGKAGTPRELNYYYKIVANAMYARLMEQIASDASNRVVPIGGLGSASISVPISDIRKYVADYVPAFCAHHVLGSEGACPAETSDGSDSWPAECSVEDMRDLVAWIMKGVRCDGAAMPEPRDDEEATLLARARHACEPDRIALGEQLEQSLEDKEYEETAAIIADIEDAQSTYARVSEIVSRAVSADFWGKEAAGEEASVGGRLLAALGHAPSEQDLKRVRGTATAENSSAGPGFSPLGLALQRIVEASSVTAKRGIGDKSRSFTVSIGGFGTKAVLLQAIHNTLTTFVKELASVSLGDEEGDSPSLAFEQARRGIWPWSRITTTESELISGAADRTSTKNYVRAIQRCILDLLEKARDEVEVLRSAYAAVATELQSSRSRQMKTLEQRKHATFWTHKDFERILKSEADELYDRGLLAEQPLKPYYRGDALFAKELAEVASSPSNKSFTSALEQCRKRIDDWLKSVIERGRGVAGASKTDCRHIIEDQIVLLANNLTIPPRFYQDHFGFYETVQGHVLAWARELRERAAAAHEREILGKAFDIRFGLKYPCDKDGMPIERDTFAAEVCDTMALTLGQRTDLLYEARRDFGEQRVYDAVTVVLPQEEAFRRDVVNKRIDATASGLPEFARPGTFSVVAYDPDLHAGGNPYLMIAYTHSAFPDWKRDAGINRITSLHYHDDREVHEWLAACEETGGKSWFVEDDTVLRNASNSFGLGYVSPQFVRDDTMARLRWRPWLNLRTDETRHRHSLDLIAYSCLEVPKKPEFASLAKVHEDRDWRQPLLHVPTARGSDLEASLKVAFTRGVICWDGEDKRRRDIFWDADAVRHAEIPQAPRKSFERRTLHRFVDDLKSERGKDMAEAIANEAVMYLAEVIGDAKFELRISPKESLWAMFTSLRDRLQEEIGVLDGAAIPAETKEELLPLYRRLLERVQALRRMSLKELQDHYESIRSHFQR